MNTIVKNINEENIDKTVIREAAEIIKNGGLVAFPTETVYGLGGSAIFPGAAEKIYAAKGRPSDNPLIIHICRAEDAEKYAYTNELFYKLCNAFSPGPLTVVLKKRDMIPDSVSGGLDTVAVRIPDNPIALALIKEADVAIAAPSANLSGRPSPTKAKHVIEDLWGRVDMIIDGGDCKIGVESTVVKLTSDGICVLRPGGVTVEMLKKLTDNVTLDEGLLKKPKDDFKPEAPGMKYKHYAPRAEVYLVEGDERKIIEFMKYKLKEDPSVGIICYEDMKISSKNTKTIGRLPESQAHEIFDTLRSFDGTEAEKVYSVIPSSEGIGLAVLNRLMKAAGFKKITL